MANKQDAVRLLLKGFQGPESERNKLARVLERADFFPNDYGVLAYSLAEMQVAGGSMTTAVQNLVGAKVSQRFDEAYSHYIRDFKAGDPQALLTTTRYGRSLSQPIPREEYFAKNRSAYFDVLNQPINLSWAREQKDPRTGRTTGEMLPSAFQATTVYDAINWLARSEIPQVIQQIVHTDVGPDGKIDWRSVGRNFMDEVQTGWLGGYMSIPNYKAPTPSDKNNFSLFFGDQSLKAIRQFREDEKTLSNGKVSLGFFEGEDGEYNGLPGGGINAAGDLINAHAGISADNSFTERSLFPHNDAALVEKVQGAILGAQNRNTQDIFGAYSHLNVQTGQVEVDREFGRGDFGKTNASLWEAGIDAPNVQVFGIDPNSPAGQMGMKEGAMIQSFNRILQSPKLASLVDAFQNGHASAIAYMQPDEDGVMTEYVSVFQPAPIVGRSADQGREDNWIKQLANTFDPEMGRTALEINATWRRAPGGDYEYVSLPPTVSRTEGHSAIPVELWTTDEKYTSGMVPDAQGNWTLAPLANRPGGKFNTRVQLDPQSMRMFGDLYDTWHTEWTGQKKIVAGIEAEARKTVEERYARAVQIGTAAKFPALETAVERETLQGLKRAGIDPQHASFIRGGVMMEQEIRRLSRSVSVAAAEVEPEYNIDQFDNLVNSLPRQEQRSAGQVSENAVRTEMNRTGDKLLAAQNRMRWKDAADRAVYANRDPGGYQGGGFGQMGGMEEPVSSTKVPFSLGALAADPDRAEQFFRPYQTSSQGYDALGSLTRPRPGSMMVQPLSELSDEPAAPDPGGLMTLQEWGLRSGMLERTTTPSRPIQPSISSLDESVRSHIASLNSFTRFQPGAQTEDPWIEQGVYRSWGQSEGTPYLFARLPEIRRDKGPTSEWLVPQSENQSNGVPTSGMRLAGTGHRPDKLGGYNNPEAYQRLVALAEEQIDTLQPSRVISGAAQGWDQALADAALNRGVPVTMVVPFEGFSSKWPRAAQRRLTNLLGRIDAQQGGFVLNLHPEGLTEDPTKRRSQAAKYLQERNEVMIDNADMTLALYNNDPKGGTASAVAYSMVAGKPVKNIWGEFAGGPTRTQIPQPFPDDPASVDNDQDILGGNPGSYVDQIEPGSGRQRVYPPSVQRANRQNSDPLIAARMKNSEDQIRDIALEEANEGYSLDAADRAYQEALVISNPNAPEASNSAKIGRFGSTHGYFENGWGDFFNEMNRSHPENYATYKALQPMMYAAGRAEVESAGVKQLQEKIRQAQAIHRPDVAAHIRLGETPEYVEEAKKSRTGYPREALRQASEAYGLELSWQRGKEGALFGQLETLKAGNPGLYERLRGSVLADPAAQLRTANAWDKKVKSVPAQKATPQPARALSTAGNADELEEPTAEAWEIFGEAFWDNAAGFDFENGDMPADRQAKAAYAYGLSVGDISKGREMVLYPLAKEGTPQPARNLPHFTENVTQTLREQFTNPDFEESGFLVGRVNEQGGVDVFDVVKPEQKGLISKHRTRTTPEMVAEANRMAEERGGFLAGYIHTHPGDPSQEPQYLRPSNTDVLTRSLAGRGSLHNGNWGEDSVHAIFNPVSGNVAYWNHGKKAVIDVTEKVREPSMKPARVGLRKNRRVFAGVEAQNSFEMGDMLGNILPPDEPPGWSEEDWARMANSDNGIPEEENLGNFPMDPAENKEAWYLRRGRDGMRWTFGRPTPAEREEHDRFVAANMPPESSNPSTAPHTDPSPAPARAMHLDDGGTDPRLAPRNRALERRASREVPRDNWNWRISAQGSVSSAGNNRSGNGATPPAGSNGNGAGAPPPPPPPPPGDGPEPPDFPDDWDRQERRIDPGNAEEVAEAVEDARAARSNGGGTHTVAPAREAAANSTPNPRRNRTERDERRTTEAQRTVINDPVQFSRLKPQSNWVFESEDEGGGFHFFQARKTGVGPAADVAWFEMDEDTGAFHRASARNLPRWGTISHEGRIIADVSQEAYQEWNAGRGSLTPIERASAAVREKVGLDQIKKIRRRELNGEVRPVGDNQEAFEFVTEDADFSGNKRVLMSSEDISSAHATALRATSSALGSTLPNDPVAKVAAVKQRILDNALEDVDKYVENQIKSGTSPDIARANGERFKQVVIHYADAAARVVEQSMGTDLRVTGGDVQKWNTTDIRLKNTDEVQALIERSPEVKRQIEEAGLTPGAIWKAGQYFPVRDEEGHVFDIGSQGKYSRGWGGQRSGGPGGIWGGGKMGSLMYGAYMLHREWQMAAGPVLQAAEKYGTDMAAYAPLLYSGDAMGGSDVGFAYRQEMGQEFMGRAAYSQFGALMDVPYRLSETGNYSAARLLQTGGISFGLATGGVIGGAMLSGMGMAAAGGVLATGGLVVGGALMAGVAGMEVYNNFFKPDDAPDLTVSSVINEVEKDNYRNEARARRKERLGQQDENQTAAMAAYYMGATSPGMGPNAGPMAQWAAQQELNKYEDDRLIPDEELMQDLSPEGKLLWADEKTNHQAEALREAVANIRGKTLEEKNTLTKALSIQKHYTGAPNAQLLDQVSDVAVSLGLGSDESLQQGAAYASQMGYLQNTPDFERAMYALALEADPVKRAGMTYTATRTAQLGSQLQAVMGTDGRFAGLGARMVTAYGLNNQAKAGAFTSIAAGMQTYGADFAPFELDQIGSIARDNNPFVANVLGNAMEGYMMDGGSQVGAISLGLELSSAGMSSQDASVYGRMMQGDLRAYSYNAWQTGNMDNAFYDKAGRSITQYNGRIANQVYNHWAPKLSLSQMTDAQFLGTNNQEILSAWNAGGGNGGFAGLQLLASEKSYQASMASAGIQMRGIALTENFNWGANAGGTWNNPTSGSSWGIQDRQLALQDASTRAGFADQWARMTAQNSFSIQNENLQAQRMQVSQQYQTFQFSQQYNQFRQSQAWAQEDWQYQDTSRQQSFGWQMEDLNEAIRFASGRDRKQLIKQRERLATTESQESDQIDTQRDRQKQLWAQQEESFQKQKQYTADLQRLDQEGFALQKHQRETFFKMDTESYNKRVKEYEEEKKLSDELRGLQRKHEYDQLQLQKESAGVQAGAAAIQHEINKAMVEGQKNWETMQGRLENMNTYANAFRLMSATQEMLKTADGTSTYKMQKIMELLKALSAVNTSKVWGGEVD